MAEQIISKRCSTCKENKSVSEFHKNRATKDGYHSQCKICIKAYQQSEDGKATQRKAHCRYRQTEKGKIHEKQYQQSEIGKATYRRSVDKNHKRFPEHRKAVSAVNNAIRAGKLPRPDSLKCSCGEQAEHYHHHKGYEPEHWLDVVPVCVPCHYLLAPNN